jgi:hypothetical protein
MGVERGSVTAAFQNGDVYLRQVSGASTYGLVSILRLSDGQIVAAVQQRARLDRCVIVGNAAASPFVVPFLASTDGFGLLVSTVDPTVGTLSWPSNWIAWKGSTTSVFSNDSLWGVALDDGSIRVSDGLPAMNMLKVDQGPVPSFRTYGRSNVALWTLRDASAGLDVIKIYVPGAGAKQLVNQPNTNAQALAASDRIIAWIGTHGQRVLDGTYDAAELYWSPFVTSPKDAVVTQGPSLPAQNDLHELQTTGDYAATIGCGATGPASCNVLIVQMSTRKLWALSNRPSSLFLDVLALSDTEVFLAEIDWPSAPQYLQQIQRFVRIRLGDLDSLAGGW